MTAGLALACASLAIWVYLIAARGGFWRASERDDRAPPREPRAWPAVCAVIPARDEADVIAESLGSLLRQDYAGSLQIVVVDDQSQDGTAEAARRCAADPGAAAGLAIVRRRPPPPAAACWCAAMRSRQRAASRASAAR